MLVTLSIHLPSARVSPLIIPVYKLRTDLSLLSSPLNHWPTLGH